MAALLVGSAMVVAASPCSGFAQAGAGVRAYVGNRDALIVFPVPEKEVWHWFSAESKAGALEYAWTIQVGRNYHVGFSLFNPGPAGHPTSGTLVDLLQWGQRTLWLADPETGSLSAAPPIELELVAMDGQLLMHLDDEDVVQMLFSERPSTITFETVMEKERAAQGTIHVQYTQLDDKLWSGAASDGELSMGSPAPEFELPILHHTGAASATQRLWIAGDITVLYFWTSHCPVSRSEFDEVMKDAQRWAGRGVRVVGITTRQDPDADRAFLTARPDNNVTHLVASAAAEEAYRVRGTPYVVVVDRTGRIAHRAMSSGQWEEGGVLTRKLNRLLQIR